MELTNEFSVPVPVERAWAVLLDVEKVAPCMPGATLTSFDGESFEGNVKVKLGPVSLTYGGKGRFVSRDDAARTAVIEASGKDTRGRGTAAATVTASLHPDEAGTLVRVVTDLKVTGSPAQFGRGMIADVSKRLVDQFATCLAGKFTDDAAPAPAGTQAAQATPAPADNSLDLLEVTGFKRYVPYVLGGLAIVAAVVIYLIVR
ncbi:MAG TPA: SRPBCC family protein [Candidatus Limnocylindrales bacterium]